MVFSSEGGTGVSIWTASGKIHCTEGQSAESRQGGEEQRELGLNLKVSSKGPQKLD